jgi:hypothetical protein
MVSVTVNGSRIEIETDRYRAAVATEGYVSGVSAGSFVDRKCGAHDPGFGLVIVDFLLSPGPEPVNTPPERHYISGDAYHGNILKRYAALPQICTQAKKLEHQLITGNGFAAVRQWFTWNIACPPYPAGSKWEQMLLFPDGERWFLAWDRFTVAGSESAHTKGTHLQDIALRMDMPCHIKHGGGDVFDEVYLSYRSENHGRIPQTEFHMNFPPDEKYLYRRGRHLPHHYIRGIKLTDGPWLAGIALDPSAVHEAWCHQRDYVCMIQEVGGRADSAGWHNALNLVGWFDSIEQMHSAAERFKGAQRLKIGGDGWETLK